MLPQRQAGTPHFLEYKITRTPAGCVRVLERLNQRPLKFTIGIKKKTPLILAL